MSLKNRHHTPWRHHILQRKCQQKLHKYSNSLCMLTYRLKFHFRVPVAKSCIPIFLIASWAVLYTFFLGKSNSLQLQFFLLRSIKLGHFITWWEKEVAVTFPITLTFSKPRIFLLVWKRAFLNVINRAESPNYKLLTFLIYQFW